jgi:hypothetical protein
MEENKKMSYEELEQVAQQLSQQTQQLYVRLQQADMTNAFRRLDYLFKVIENHLMFSMNFVESCAKEIENTITIPEENQEEQNNNGEGKQ